MLVFDGLEELVPGNGFLAYFVSRARKSQVNMTVSHGCP